MMAKAYDLAAPTMNQANPFATVVIPTFNAAKWLGLTLESWLSQSDPDFELIVVDDGSTDETVAIAESFRSSLDIRVVRESRSGAPARPCNVGIRLARGLLILFCDADDLAEVDRLQRTRKAWLDSGEQPSLIFSDFSEVDANGELIQSMSLCHYSALVSAHVTPIGGEFARIEATVAFDALIRGNFIRPCAVAVPKQLLERVGGFDESLKNGQDYDLYLRIARSYPLIWIRRALGRHRSSPGNISSRPATDLAPSRIAVLEKLISSPLTRSQAAAVRSFVAGNYMDMGYECATRGQVAMALRYHAKAFSYVPSIAPLRGILVALAKGGNLTRHRR